ncbi:MAG TPA: hypothetical protein VK588_16980, partial [Chitinophagaceae bacterium]|nr:hypothetical protein [Chitinophagaceae bacterium]
MTRKATQADFDFIFHLHVHPQVNRFLFYEIMSAEEFKSIFDALLVQGILYVMRKKVFRKACLNFFPKNIVALTSAFS